MKSSLTFIHITDTHFGPQRDFLFHSYHAVRHAEKLISLINAMPQPPDFVIHTGDVSTDKSAGSYEIAQEVWATLKAPLYFVCGNHDDRRLLRQYLNAPSHASNNPAAPLDYTFAVNGERLVVLDAHTAAVRDPLGQLSAAQLDWLESELRRDDRPVTVFLHFPPFRLGSPWFDSHMILTNGEALHALLVTAQVRVRGVFFGHTHHSYQVRRDGITYTCAASGVAQFSWRPWDEEPYVDEEQAPAYNVVRYDDDQALVQQYTFLRP